MVSISQRKRALSRFLASLIVRMASTRLTAQPRMLSQKYAHGRPQQQQKAIWHIYIIYKDFKGLCSLLAQVGALGTFETTLQQHESQETEICPTDSHCALQRCKSSPNLKHPETKCLIILKCETDWNHFLLNPSYKHTHKTLRCRTHERKPSFWENMEETIQKPPQ